MARLRLTGINLLNQRLVVKSKSVPFRKMIWLHFYSSLLKPIQYPEKLLQVIDAGALDAT